MKYSPAFLRNLGARLPIHCTNDAATLISLLDRYGHDAEFMGVVANWIEAEQLRQAALALATEVLRRGLDDA